MTSLSFSFPFTFMSTPLFPLFPFVSLPLSSNSFFFLNSFYYFFFNYFPLMCISLSCLFLCYFSFNFFLPLSSFLLFPPSFSHSFSFLFSSLVSVPFIIPLFIIPFLFSSFFTSFCSILFPLLFFPSLLLPSLTFPSPLLITYPSIPFPFP